MRNHKMKSKPKLSVFGWIVFISIFAGLGYWFSFPIKPMTAFLSYTQTILKVIVFVMTVVYQLNALKYFDPDDDDEKAVPVSLIPPAIIQVIAFVGFERTESYVVNAPDLAGMIMLIYLIITTFMTVVYGFIILALGFNLITTLCKSIIKAVHHPEQTTSVFAKLLFKQEKPTKKVKM